MTAQLPSKARLEERIRAEIELLEISLKNGGSDSPHNDEELLEVFRFALAAHEQEPVAWQYRVSAGQATGWSLWHEGKGEQYEKSYQVERRPLYTHPAPVPAIPVKWPEKLTWSYHDDMTQAEVSAWNNAIDACRAAMLNGGKS